MLIHDLEAKKLIHPPKWLADNVHYLVQMGSVAYGVSTDASDVDLYGFAIPHADMVFPHLAGDIPGFGTQKQRFEQWAEAHIKDGEKEYDFAVYNIVKFFQLCMENNPNMTDSLFVPDRCILHQTKVGLHVRRNRKIFLHKGSFHKFIGYAYGQFKKIRSKKNHSNPKRQASIDAHGYDVKFGYHIVRLALECEQILMEGDLDLERNSGVLKAIRNGDWTLDRLEQWFADKERGLNTLYETSPLQHSPDEAAIKKVLVECLEMHFGDLSKMAVKVETPVDLIVRELEAMVDRYKGR